MGGGFNPKMVRNIWKKFFFHNPLGSSIGRHKKCRIFFWCLPFPNIHIKKKHLALLLSLNLLSLHPFFPFLLIYFVRTLRLTLDLGCLKSDGKKVISWNVADFIMPLTKKRGAVAGCTPPPQSTVVTPLARGGSRYENQSKYDTTLYTTHFAMMYL